jgi:serralysin
MSRKKQIEIEDNISDLYNDLDDNDLLHNDNNDDDLNGEDWIYTLANGVLEDSLNQIEQISNVDNDLYGDTILEGSTKTDSFHGGFGDDYLNGGDDDDLLEGGDGDDHLVGGNGTDTALYAYHRNHTDIHDNGDGTYTVTDGVFEDTLSEVEQISFSDGSISVGYAIEIRSHQEEIARFYNALFERNPDEGGLSYWVNNLADPTIGGGGSTIQDIAQAFTQSEEFQALYGSNVSNSNFVNLLYQNILHRNADQAGYEYWLNEINETNDRGSTIVGFSNSAEYVTETASAIDNFLANVTLDNYLLA